MLRLMEQAINCTGAVAEEWSVRHKELEKSRSGEEEEEGQNGDEDEDGVRKKKGKKKKKKKKKEEEGKTGNGSEKKKNPLHEESREAEKALYAANMRHFQVSQSVSQSVSQ